LSGSAIETQLRQLGVRIDLGRVERRVGRTRVEIKTRGRESQEFVHGRLSLLSLPPLFCFFLLFLFLDFLSLLGFVEFLKGTKTP
jgi:hypothetical protein